MLSFVTLSPDWQMEGQQSSKKDDWVGVQAGGTVSFVLCNFPP